MEDGVTGRLGVTVPHHVMVDCREGQGAVQTQNHQMEEPPAQGKDYSSNSAINNHVKVCDTSKLFHKVKLITWALYVSMSSWIDSTIGDPVH